MGLESSPMIKIFGAGRGKRAEEPKAGEEAAAGPKKRQPGEIRIQKELDELELPQQCQIAFPDPNALMKFHITITPDEGYWKGASYMFVFTVPGMYPARRAQGEVRHEDLPPEH